MTHTCNTCGLCCSLFYINLSKKEYESKKFLTIFDNENHNLPYIEAKDCGANFLAKKTDNSCIYLENNLCSIHRDRPNVCRHFFCSTKSQKFKSMVDKIKLKKL